MLKMVTAVNDAYQAIRQHNPGVPNAVIVVGASSTQNRGHFQANSWAGDNGTQHEIVLNGESLRRSAADVFGTLLHEAVHAAMFEANVIGTSREGRYHNGRFKVYAEKMGLVAVKDTRIGITTSLSAEAAKLYSKEITAIRQALKTYRIGEATSPRARKKRTVLLRTASGRTLRVPNTFMEGGSIFDSVTGEIFEVVKDAS
jgi:hypothetical protein